MHIIYKRSVSRVYKDLLEIIKMNNSMEKWGEDKTR